MMINMTSQSGAASEPLYSEEHIIQLVQARAVVSPAPKSYGSFAAEWIEDIEAIDLMTEICAEYELLLAALREENARLKMKVLGYQAIDGDSAGRL
jgi:hypothetical protein